MNNNVNTKQTCLTKIRLNENGMTVYTIKKMIHIIQSICTKYKLIIAKNKTINKCPSSCIFSHDN